MVMFATQRRWLMATALACSAAYALFDKIVQTPTVPPGFTTSLAFAFFLLVMFELFRKILGRRAGSRKT